MNKNFILGLGGKKRVGKNTLANAFIKIFAAKNILAKQYAFADELKKELDPLFLLNAGVSAFTEDPLEKELVRKTLISYGSGYWRIKDPDHWIKRLAQNLDNQSLPHIALITDARFASNEIPWIQKQGGKIIHISRFQDNGEEFPPAGEDEERNDPLIKNMADFRFSWNNFNDNLENCYYTAAQFFNEIFAPQDILRWQQDFPIQT